MAKQDYCRTCVHERSPADLDPCADCLTHGYRLPRHEMRPTIPLTECVDRGVYRIKSRNLIVGVFREATGGFIGIREKFGSKFLFEEYHYDKPFGTTRPFEKVGDLPEGIENDESLHHEKGRLWTDGVPLGKKGERRPEADRAVVRRNLKEGEQPHGTRQGFVDEYADTGERLPDDVWPFGHHNDKLFDYLEEMEKKEA